jgi:hypothetical protein
MQLPRRIIVPGWNAYARIFAPVSRDPTEGDGTRKKLTNRKKKNRASKIVFFDDELMTASFDKPHGPTVLTI